MSASAADEASDGSERPPSVALITGASRGIGKATALRLSAAGYAVAITYKENEAAALSVVETILEAGGRALALPLDLENEDPARTMHRTRDEFGRLDALVLNAGVSAFAPLGQFAPREFERLFVVNVKSAFLAFQCADRLLSDGGRIVAVSSDIALNPIPSSAAYSASKGALGILARGAARELGGRGITVNIIEPGITETDGLVLSTDAIQHVITQTPLGRVGRPEDVAAVVSFLLSTDAQWITAQTIRVNGGFF